MWLCPFFEPVFIEFLLCSRHWRWQILRIIKELFIFCWRGRQSCAFLSWEAIFLKNCKNDIDDSVIGYSLLQFWGCWNTAEKVELCRLLPLQMLLQPSLPVPITMPSRIKTENNPTVPLVFLFANFCQYPVWAPNFSALGKMTSSLSLALALDPIPPTSSKTSLYHLTSFCIYNFSFGSFLSTCKLTQIFLILKRKNEAPSLPIKTTQYFPFPMQILWGS